VSELRRDIRRSDRVIRFIEALTVPSGIGAGKPFKLEPFQWNFIRDIYEPHIGKNRAVRRAILSIARKNGKTALIAHSRSGGFAVQLALEDPSRYSHVIILGTGSLLPLQTEAQVGRYEAVQARVDQELAQKEPTLEDARTKGAVLVNLAEQQIPDAKRRKFAPHLVLNPTEDMIVMQREIFGPILPIKTYADRQEVADYINSHDRPLAIYPFTHNAELRDFYISRVMSGGVSVNEALLHVGQHDLPFGGVGASGMGHYHAREGFNTFSKLRPVFYQGPLSPIQMLFQPPYSGRPMSVLQTMIKWKT